MYHKISEWMSADKWVMTEMGAARGGEWTYKRLVAKTWRIAQEEEHPFCTLPEGVLVSSADHDEIDGGNYFQISLSDHDVPSNSATNSVMMSVEAGAMFGPPQPLKSLPDGSEILEAHAEINGGGLTRTTQDGADPTLSNISYMLVGFTGPSAWEPIGKVAGAANGTKVLNITSWIQTMMQERATGKYGYGYAAIFVPHDLVFGEGGGIDSLLPDGPPGIQFVPDPEDLDCGGFHAFEPWKFELMTWGTISVGRIVVKVRYPETERQRYGAMMPALPPMV